MNKEDYVSLEVAKLLKEKGFPQIHEVGVICRLENKVNPYYRRTRGITQSDIENGWCIFNETYPTLYEAAKWLRNKHDINIFIPSEIPMQFGRKTDDNNISYIPSIEYKKEDGEIEMAIFHNLADFDYEKVYNAGILEALKLI